MAQKDVVRQLLEVIIGNVAIFEAAMAIEDDPKHAPHSIFPMDDELRQVVGLMFPSVEICPCKVGFQLKPKETRPPP